MSPQTSLIFRFLKGVIKPCWQSVFEADSDGPLIAMALYVWTSHLDVHPCPTSENTWPTTVIYLQTSRTTLVVSRVCQLVYSRKRGTGHPQQLQRLTGLAGPCHASCSSLLTFRSHVAGVAPSTPMVSRRLHWSVQVLYLDFVKCPRNCVMAAL